MLNKKYEGIYQYLVLCNFDQLGIQRTLNRFIYMQLTEVFFMVLEQNVHDSYVQSV